MRSSSAFIFFPVLFMLIVPVNGQDILVTPVGGPRTISTFDRGEWIIDPGRTYRNPFDPAEISVDAVFTAPSGATTTVPAFWDSPGVNTAGFTLRFAPNEAGSWSFQAIATDASVRRTSPALTFQVGAGEHPGFIRRAPNNRYLCFDSGKSYFPIGINLCWPADDSPPLKWYPDAFNTLSQNGANYVRLWLCHSPFMLESSKTGLGRYDQGNAQLFDKLLASAQEHNIGVMLCLMNHREFLDRDMWGPAGWPASPYNAKNAGPATRPIDFFTNSDARRAFKGRLRYIIARYSAYTSIAFWEIFNEQEYAGTEVPLAWNAEMSSYLRRIDPAKHLITTSANVPAAVWELPDIDLTQSHIYGDGTQIDLLAPLASSAAEHEQFHKPHLIGETGLDFHGPDTKFDPAGNGAAFHNSLWAAMMTGDAGTAMYWWWDSYVGPQNLWHEFKSVSKFASDIDWAHRNFQPIAIPQLWRSTADDQMTDLTVAPSSGWGSVARQTIVIPPNGRLLVPVPRYLYGPGHPELHIPLRMEIDLPAASQMVLDVSRASDYAMVRIFIDDKPTADFAFSALPGSPSAEKSQFDPEHQIYQADVNKKYRVPISAGHHRIKIDPIAGDWITLSKITFTDALSSRYADLAGFAMQDAESQETLLWIVNTRAPRQGDPPQQSVQLIVPNITTGSYSAQCWNTRTGIPIQTDSVTPAQGRLMLTVPTFIGDIALRLERAGETQSP